MDVKRWSELKEAFHGLVDLAPADQARQLAVLAASDPELHRQVEALLAADARGESLQGLFDVVLPTADRPTRIGAYTITGVLGAGGMGEVYRAHDSRLRREVAIKILPPAFTRDRERLTRFEREAQVLASLNHAHIAHVYGLEDSDGTPALVMELVHGPTLDEVIARTTATPIPLAQVLTIARQIADGLDAAHEKGIIHRDLKPRNVALSERGDVKILDFGVAKILADNATSAVETVDATNAGSVLGTPAYMSPEQARGLPVDKRTDIWAFGCVLYELLTGRRPFSGKTAADSIAAILERDPDMTILPTSTPTPVRSLLRHCLEKDPRRRLRDIADARLAIDDLLNQPIELRGGNVTSGTSAPVPRRSRIWERILWMLAGLGIAGAAAAVIVSQRLPRGADTDARTVFASIVLPGGLHLSGDTPEAQYADARFAVSPDGRRLVLVAGDHSGRARLWVRDLASPAFQPLPETEGASYPFWSPDSQHVAFLAEGKLKRIRAEGGRPTTICDGGFRTGSWSHNDVILFAPARSSALARVSAAGGEPTPATTLDQDDGEVQHSYPIFLPDGNHFLYFGVGSKTAGAIDPRGVYLGSLDGGTPAKLLLPGVAHAKYAGGYLLFVRGGMLMAQPFDLTRNELRGQAIPLVERVNVPTAGATGVTGAFSVSDNGVLVYQAGVITQSQPTWFDRAGKQVGTLGAAGDYSDVALSPDGANLAVSVMDQTISTRDLWLYDVNGGRGQRFTFGSGDDFAPTWSPDSKRLLFSSSRKGAVDLWVKDVGGVGDEQPVKGDMLGLGKFATDWSRDGRFIMYIGGARVINRSDLWIVPLGAQQDARALLESAFVETHGRFAPDSKWFVYTSLESQQSEVYVDRFPGRGAKTRVSTAGGGWARWGKDGSEIRPSIFHRTIA